MYFSLLTPALGSENQSVLMQSSPTRLEVNSTQRLSIVSLQRGQDAAHCCDEDIQKEPHLTEGAGHGRVYTYEGVIAISREVGVISRRNKWDHEVHTLFSPFPIQFIFLFLLGIQVRKYIKNMNI